MGKGDRRSFKGKLFKGSFGNSRNRKKLKKNNVFIPTVLKHPKPKPTIKIPAVEVAETAPVVIEEAVIETPVALETATAVAADTKTAKAAKPKTPKKPAAKKEKAPKAEKPKKKEKAAPKATKKKTK